MEERRPPQVCEVMAEWTGQRWSGSTDREEEVLCRPPLWSEALQQPNQRGLWKEKFGDRGQAELIQASEPNETACFLFLNETVNYSDAASDKWSEAAIQSAAGHVHSWPARSADELSVWNANQTGQVELGAVSQTRWQDVDSELKGRFVRDSLPPAAGHCC